MAIIDLKNCLFEIRDGASHKLVLRIGQGNLTFSEKRNIDYILNRGILDQARLGDQVPVEVKFEFEWEYITGAGFDNPIAPVDAFKKVGSASAWTSTDPDACKPYSVDIYMFNIPPCTATNAETIVLPEYRWETLDYDAKAGSISTSGKCNVTDVTATRGTATT